MINKNEAKKLAKKFNINLDVVNLEQWETALNTELEHGKELGKKTNITNDNNIITAMIAIAHLIEDPQYYYRLVKMENEAKKFWSKNKKPNIFNN
jgi:hypothetical protein